MRTEVSPKVIAAIVAAVVVLVGFVYWKSTAGPSPTPADKIPPGLPGGPPPKPGQLPVGANPVTPQGAPTAQ